MSVKKIYQPATLPQRMKHLFSAPFIYVVIVPALFLHVFIELYHSVCFPLYGISYVDRKKYLKIDRHKLSYLNWLDRLNCVYCGYMNGLFAYITAIAAETEKYWCPIRHAVRKGYVEPKHHSQFAKFGDREGYKDVISKR
jgi:hypothetical protein